MRERGHQRVGLGVDMKERQADPEPLRSFEADPPGERPSALGVGGVPHQDAFRPAGGPGCVHDRRHPERLSSGWPFGFRRRGKGLNLVAKQRDRRLQVGPQLVELGAGQLGVDSRRDPAGPNRAEPPVHQRRRVRCGDQHPIAGVETAAAQRLSRAAS